MNAQLRHELPLGDEKELITTIDYSWEGGRYWWIDNQDKQSGVHLINASIGLRLNKNVEFMAWCKNCVNEIYDSAYEPAELVLFGGPAKDVAYQARERTWGFNLKYQF